MNDTSTAFLVWGGSALWTLPPRPLLLLSLGPTLTIPTHLEPKK
jgi:hypothetical protein